MLDHMGIFVSNTDRSFRFFEAAVAPLGIVVRERQRNHNQSPGPTLRGGAMLA